MELSKQKQIEAKKLNVPAQYLIMADLCALGYSEQDAYIIAYPENAALSVKQNTSIRTNIFESDKFKRLLEERNNRVKDGITAAITLEDVKLVDTEDVMKEILRSAQHQPLGSKERADLFAKYNDIKTKAEQGVEDDTEAIKFVFPLKCSQCPLLYAYNEEAKKCKDEKGNIIHPVEMGRVIKLSQKIIQAALDAEE